MTTNERLNNLENAINEIKTILLGKKDMGSPVVKENKYQYLIDEIMEQFDFNKVHEVMTFLDWKWVTKRGHVIPTLDEIRAEANRLLGQAVMEQTTIATGGFKAQFVDSPDGEEPFLGLEFIVEDTANY